MKLRHLLLSFLLGFVLLTPCINAQYALVDFMYVPEGGEDTYIQMEKSYAKPVHQKLINEDKLAYWGLFRVAYPAGTGAEYQYVTVRMYDGPEQLGLSNQFLPVFEEVHKDEILEAITATVFNTRDLVYTHKLYQWEMFQPSDAEAHPEIVRVNYLKVPPLKWSDYVDMEKKVYHPMHKKEMEMGVRAGWQGYRLSSPMGTSMPYTHVTADMYKDWSQYTKEVDRDVIRKAVHPNKKLDDMNKNLFSTVEFVRVEEWHLVDYVMKEN